MKKLPIFGLSSLALIGLATVGKHYFIYNEVKKFQQKNKDKIQIKSLEWRWNGVSLRGVDINYQNSKTIETCHIDQIQLDHKWIKPLQVQVFAANVTAPRLEIVMVQGGLSYLFSAFSSEDLLLLKATISIGKSDKLTPIEFPQVSMPFTYNITTHKLKLDVDIPTIALENYQISDVALKASGEMTVKPSLTGSLSLKIKNVSKVIEILVDKKVIKAKKAQWLIMGSKLLSDSNNESTLPLIFNEGNVFLGPVKIFSHN